jgi:hypothetical protein
MPLQNFGTGFNSGTAAQAATSEMLQNMPKNNFSNNGGGIAGFGNYGANAYSQLGNNPYSQGVPMSTNNSNAYANAPSYQPAQAPATKKDALGGAGGAPGAAGMFAQGFNLGFNAIYGGIMKPKVAQLQAEQMRLQADIDAETQHFNARQLRQYSNDLTGYMNEALQDRVTESIRFSQEQQAASTANGNWYGPTFNSFLLDTVNKTIDDLSNMTETTHRQQAKLKFDATMIDIQASYEWDMAQAQADATVKQGYLEGAMSFLGI